MPLQLLELLVLVCIHYDFHLLILLFLFLFYSTLINLNVNVLLLAGFAEVLPIVEADLKKRAAKVVEKAKEVCQKKSVSTLFIITYFFFTLNASNQP